MPSALPCTNCLYHAAFSYPDAGRWIVLAAAASATATSPGAMRTTGPYFWCSAWMWCTRCPRMLASLSG